MASCLLRSSLIQPSANKRHRLCGIAKRDFASWQIQCHRWSGRLVRMDMSTTTTNAGMSSPDSTGR